MNMMSPPTAVTPTPIATPGCDVRVCELLVEEARPAQVLAHISAGVTRSG